MQTLKLIPKRPNELGFGRYVILLAVLALAVAAVGIKLFIASRAAAGPLITYNSGATTSSDYIYTISSRGTVTNTKQLGSLPVWGNNSSNIFYTGVGDKAIYSMGSDGQSPREIVTSAQLNGQYIAGITWSEAAHKLAILVASSFIDGPYSIYTANADGSGLKDITLGQPTQFIGSIAWSPNGKYIALTNQTAAPQVLEIITSDGTVVSILGDYYSVGVNPWSPNSSELTFVRHTQQNQENIVTANISGTNSRTVAKCPASAVHCYLPTWSPDGSSIAYGVFGPNASLDVLKLSTGTTKTEAWSKGGVSAIDWSPDSKSLAVTSGPLYVVNIGSMSRTKLANLYSDTQAFGNTIDWSIQ